MLVSLREILSHPAVAAFLGLALGLSFLLISRASFRAITPERLEAGLVTVAVALLARLAASTFLLWAYHAFVRPGFVPFALAFAGGFIVHYMVELVRFAGIPKRIQRAGHQG